MRAPLAALAAALGAALAALVGPAPAGATRTTPCGLPGYSYAGIGGLAVASGVGANIRLAARPEVTAGHVAAWVGLGGYGAGPGSTDAWLQAGIITKAGAEPTLYYEVTRPGFKPKLVELAPARTNRSYRFVVRELKRPGWWQVTLDGRAVTPPISLPGSHARWEATATAESWDGGESTCNRFRVGFEKLAVTEARGAWAPFGRRFTLQAPGYRLATHTSSSFLAVS